RIQYAFPQPCPAAGYVPNRCTNSQYGGDTSDSVLLFLPVRKFAIRKCSLLLDHGRRYHAGTSYAGPLLFVGHIPGFASSLPAQPAQRGAQVQPTAENILSGGDVLALSNTDCDGMGPALPLSIVQCNLWPARHRLVGPGPYVHW